MLKKTFNKHPTVSDQEIDKLWEKRRTGYFVDWDKVKKYV